MKYILMERAYEYNDEGYSSGETTSGMPIKIFDSKEDAEQAVKEATLDMFRNGKAYMYEGNEIDLKDERHPLIEIYESCGGTWGYIEKVKADPDMTMEEMQELIWALDGGEAYYIAEVPD